MLPLTGHWRTPADDVFFGENASMDTDEILEER